MVSVDLDDQLAAQVAFLQRLDDKFVACRQGHALPRIAPTKTGRLPKNTWAVGPYRDGVYQLWQTCPNCGYRRWMLTGESGSLLLPGKWHPEYPEGYLAKGLGRISSRLATSEGYRRLSELLFAAAIPPPPEE
jgi:hypothetical protein